MTTVESDHRLLVKRLDKPPAQIKENLTNLDCHMWHAATGISGEAGELLDAVKKVVIYQQPIDLQNIVEELGDLEFYIEMLRSSLGIDRETTLRNNIQKLTIRYGQSFSNQKAAERKDKKK